MEKYNFDKCIDRKGTNAIKFDPAFAPHGKEDLIPLWVADMDFCLPDEILEPIRRRVDHGIFGYTTPGEDYYKAVCSWLNRRHNMRVKADQILPLPGVVYGLTCALRAMTEPGDAVLIQEPVYYPFRNLIERNKRVCVNSQLVCRDGRYFVDFKDFEAKIRENGVRAFILCSPHNPVGRVWTREELSALCALCGRYDVKIIADEIHADFVFKGAHFTSIREIEDESAAHAIVATAPSKTFNIAGLQASNFVVADEGLFGALQKETEANGYFDIGAFASCATQAVYAKGEKWLEELLVYLEENLDYMDDFIRSEIPGLKMTRPEGTYLVWVDFSAVVQNETQLRELLVDRAGLWLDEGSLFSKETPLFARFNIACPKSVLEKALKKLKDALDREDL